MNIDTIRNEVGNRYEHQPTFLQAVTEFLNSIEEYAHEQQFTEDDYARLARLIVPERVISFKVVWANDAGVLQHNVGYRVQFNSALGPYKGGLRFDSSVNEDVLKFLGFEQIFKNALTGLPLGAGKGGSDFNPKGKSDCEIRSFCRAFMLELHRYIGIDVDVPAGDMGVGGREIGYLYGAYKEITGRNEGALTGKDELFGGSCRRTEATGHGIVYFAEAMADTHTLKLSDMKAVVSGSGNVAEYTARKLIELGATVLTLSDREGFVHKATGLTDEDVSIIAEGKREGKKLADVSLDGADYEKGAPWQRVQADLYFPCATQNEVGEDDARAMVATAKMIVEGANMPLTAEAQDVVREAGVLYAPGKPANAGGVSVSGIEMAQNASHYAWTCAVVEGELKRIMQHIHGQCLLHGTKGDTVDYVHGANIAGARRVLSAMKKLGW